MRRIDQLAKQRRKPAYTLSCRVALLLFQNDPIARSNAAKTGSTASCLALKSMSRSPPITS